MTRHRAWSDVLGGFGSLYKHLESMDTLRALTEATRPFDPILKSFEDLSAFSMATEHTRTFDSLARSLERASAFHAAANTSQTLNSLYDGFGGISAFSAAAESARNFDSFVRVFEQESAFHSIAQTFDSLHKSMEGMSVLRTATESTRTIDLLVRSWEGLAEFHSATETARTIDSLYMDLGGMSAFRAATDLARAFDTLATRLSGVSDFGVEVVLAGLAGQFDHGLTRAAVASAALIQATENEPDALAEARTQSPLLDWMMDVEAFARNLANATLKSVAKQAELLLKTLIKKYEQRREFAQSTQEKWSLDKTLNLAMAIIAIYYARQSLIVSEKSLQLAQQAAESSSQDMATLRSELSSDNTAHTEELRLFREVLERIAKHEESVEAEHADFYIVVRHTRLLASPSTKAPKLADLYPNQPLLLIEKKHKWIKVQYYDHLLGKSTEGWVQKKYLRRSKH